MAAQLRFELRCLDPRCATLLPADAELCDECGGTALAHLSDSDAVLLGEAADDRPVAFGLVATRSNVIGRMAGVDVDLSRLPGSESVHRRHVQIDAQQGGWTVTHLGRNPVVVSRPDATQVVEPGTGAWLGSGDWLQIGRIRLRFVVRGTEG